MTTAIEKEMHKPKIPGETGFCVAMLLISLTFFYLSYKISGFSSWSSAGSLPLGATFVMCATSVAIIFRELGKPSPKLAEGEGLLHGFFVQVFPMRHFVFVAVLVAYMLLLEPLGFITSSYLYLVGASLVLGERRYVYMIFVNALSLAAVYLVFQTAFSVVLPTGFVERLFQ
jgi:putative tricarboxylic transport membrane protein